jgi:hypothetical protein
MHMPTYKPVVSTLVVVILVALAMGIYAHVPLGRKATRIIPAPALLIGDPNAKVTLMWSTGTFIARAAASFFSAD